MAATPEALRSPTGADGPPAALYGKLSPGPGRSAAEVAAHQRARIHSAMVEAVADRGYAAVTVREIARLAGVSSRAFYKLFEGKEDCFFRTYDLVVRRAAKRIVEAQVGERDWRERLRRGFVAFARELGQEPQAARLVLVEAYVAGAEGLERTRRTECMFESMIAESFLRAPRYVDVPPPVIEGIVAGVTRVARARLVDGRLIDHSKLGIELAEWAMSFRSRAAEVLVGLDRRVASSGEIWRSPLGDSQVEDTVRTASDRDLILIAVAKMVAADGYDSLTVSSITSAAGIPRRSFEAHFPTVEECYLAAVDRHGMMAAEEVVRTRVAASSPEGATYHAVWAIARRASTDPAFAKLCFDDVHAVGADGLIRRDSILSSATELVMGSAATARLASQASAGAVWGIIHHRIVGGRAERLSSVVPILAFLALAPQSGAEGALTSIYAEQARIGSKARIENKKSENLTALEQPAMLTRASGSSPGASSSRNRNQDMRGNT